MFIIFGIGMSESVVVSDIERFFLDVIDSAGKALKYIVIPWHNSFPFPLLAYLEDVVLAANVY